MDLAAYFRDLELAGFRGPMALDLYQHDYEAVAPRSLAFLRARGSAPAHEATRKTV
jgi:hypothetical protein